MNSMIAIAILVSMVACGGGNNNHTTPDNGNQQQLADCQQQQADLQNLVDQFQKADRERIDEAIAATEIEDTLNNMNLFPLGIVPIWNGGNIMHACQYIQSDGSFASFRWAISDICKESGYLFLRKVFIANPALWQKVFLSEHARIAWLKKKLNVSSVNVDILPYLKDQYSTEGFHKEYANEFTKFYKIHSTSSTDGVWYHPKWKEFEDSFFRKFPTAFGSDRSEFGRAYKLWRTAHVIPAPARKILANIIEQYNAL